MKATTEGAVAAPYHAAHPAPSTPHAFHTPHAVMVLQQIAAHRAAITPLPNSKNNRGSRQVKDIPKISSPDAAEILRALGEGGLAGDPTTVSYAHVDEPEDDGPQELGRGHRKRQRSRRMEEDYSRVHRSSRTRRPAKSHLPTHPAVAERAGQVEPGHAAHGSCNCKRTRCLKLYCECFAAGAFCNEACNCLSCLNAEENRAEVVRTREEVMARLPLAFQPKVQEDGGGAGHVRGCKCRRSKCLKKYCECYQNNVPCTDKCRCTGCENGAHRYPRDPHGRGAAGAFALHGTYGAESISHPYVDTGKPTSRRAATKHHRGGNESARSSLPSVPAPNSNPNPNPRPATTAVAAATAVAVPAWTTSVPTTSTLVPPPTFFEASHSHSVSAPAPAPLPLFASLAAAAAAAPPPVPVPPVPALGPFTALGRVHVEQATTGGTLLDHENQNEPSHTATVEAAPVAPPPPTPVPPPTALVVPSAAVPIVPTHVALPHPIPSSVPAVPREESGTGTPDSVKVDDALSDRSIPSPSPTDLATGRWQGEVGEIRRLFERNGNETTATATDEDVGHESGPRKVMEEGDGSVEMPGTMEKSGVRYPSGESYPTHMVPTTEE